VTRIDAVPVSGVREPFSSLSHLLGAVLFAGLTVWLVRRGRGDRARVAALAVFGIASVFLLSMSGAYHMLWPGGPCRPVLKRLDLAAIFTLIAGTFTPAQAILFRGMRRWAPLAWVWTTAAVGVALRTAYFEAVPDWLGTAFFLALGWTGAVFAVDLRRRYGFRFISPLVLGGLAYSAGAVLLEFHWPTLLPGVFGPHELWHVAVLAGLGWHWQFVSQFAAGPPDGTC
jgi:channel protein (hemolysin III family)